MAATLDDAFVTKLAEASSGRDAVPGMDATVQFVIGKTEGATLGIADGRVAGPSSDEPDAQIVFTPAQSEAFVAGQLDLAVDYMRGDFKPTGSTRAIAAAILALTP